MIPTNSENNLIDLKRVPPPYAGDSIIMKRLQMQGELAKLKLQLGELQAAFNDQALGDNLSQELLAWYRNFSETLEDKGDHFYETKAFFIGELQRLLRCALPPYYSFTSPSTPQEQTVLIGSDGYVYGRKSLSVALSWINLHSGERYRSPLVPQDEKPFVVNLSSDI